MGMKVITGVRVNHSTHSQIHMICIKPVYWDVGKCPAGTVDIKIKIISVVAIQLDY